MLALTNSLYNDRISNEYGGIYIGWRVEHPRACRLIISILTYVDTICALRRKLRQRWNISRAPSCTCILRGAIRDANGSIYQARCPIKKFLKPELKIVTL